MLHEELRLDLNKLSVVIRRSECFEIIDLRHRVLRAGLPREAAMFPGDELPGSFHFGAFIEAHAVECSCDACVAIDRRSSEAATQASQLQNQESAICCATFHLNSWQDKPAWQLRGMATDPAWAGRGIGSAVLKFAIETIRAASSVNLFWCNARLPAVPFYQRLGWAIASERFEIPTAGPHHRMVYAGEENEPPMNADGKDLGEAHVQGRQQNSPQRRESAQRGLRRNQ